MRREFGRVSASGVKGRGNIVTEVDLAVEQLVRRTVGEHFPEHAVLGEEAGTQGDQEGWLWVVDPVDGTKNFASGIPYFCFNLALWRGSREPVLALTYEPLRREEFMAVAGQGAYVDGVRLQTSGRQTVQESVIAMDMGYLDERGKNMLALAHSLWPGMQSLRIIGSAALGMAYAACGRYDLFVHNNVYPWDIAAGILLNREAGGVVTDRDGGEVSLSSEGIVCGGPDVHADFMRLAAGRPWREAGETPG
jgi:fructose-1,6-bisphosphatase/inositol monophosphatase family enzyme